VDYLPSAKKTALDIIGLLAVNTNSVFLAQRLKLSQKHLRSSSILKYAALSMRMRKWLEGVKRHLRSKKER
jgi:hypothetical protein